MVEERRDVARSQPALVKARHGERSRSRAKEREESDRPIALEVELLRTRKVSGWGYARDLMGRTGSGDWPQSGAEISMTSALTARAEK